MVLNFISLYNLDIKLSLFSLFFSLAWHATDSESMCKIFFSSTEWDEDEVVCSDHFRRVIALS